MEQNKPELFYARLYQTAMYGIHLFTLTDCLYHGLQYVFVMCLISYKTLPFLIKPCLHDNNNT
jgi:hypothetical protein